MNSWQVQPAMINHSDVLQQWLVFGRSHTLVERGESKLIEVASVRQKTPSFRRRRATIFNGIGCCAAAIHPASGCRRVPDGWFPAFGTEFRGLRRHQPIGGRSRSGRATNEPVFRERRQAARRRRAFRRSRRPMRWMLRATTESATTRAKPSAPYARTRSRPRCSRLLIADSTAGC